MTSLVVISVQKIATAASANLTQHYSNTSLMHPLTSGVHDAKQACVLMTDILITCLIL